MLKKDYTPYIAEAERLRVLGMDATKNGELVFHWRGEGECRRHQQLARLCDGICRSGGAHSPR